LPNFPRGDVSANPVDTAGDFMSRHDRVFNAGKGTFDRVGIAVTNTARLHLDAHLAALRFGHGPFDKLVGGMGFGDLDGSHGAFS
jgi:hypothetical protein